LIASPPASAVLVPLSDLPHAVASMVQASVSAKKDFLPSPVFMNMLL
jgi:hypothetical protein